MYHMSIFNIFIKNKKISLPLLRCKFHSSTFKSVKLEPLNVYQSLSNNKKDIIKNNNRIPFGKIFITWMVFGHFMMWMASLGTIDYLFDFFDNKKKIY